MSELIIKQENSNCEVYFGSQVIDSELCIEAHDLPVDSPTGYTYIDKVEAMKIMVHLTKVFEFSAYEIGGLQ